MRTLLVLGVLSLGFSTSAFAAADVQSRQVSAAAMKMLSGQRPARTCNYSTDCLFGERCTNGQCVLGNCLLDLDCAIGERCVAGTCR